MKAPRHFPSLAMALLLAVTLAAKVRAEIQYVIAISVDGVRGDFLQTFIDTAPAEFPNFVRLRNMSAFTYNARCDYSHSITIPDHLCMLTGRPVTAPSGLPANTPHGITSDAPATTETVHNSGTNPGVYKASIFDVAHDRGLSTALYMGKNRLLICERSWDATNGALDTIGADNGRDKIDVAQFAEALGDPTATAGQTDDFVASIQAGTLRNFTLFHIADTDYAGHMSSWNAAPGSTYRNVVRTADGWLGQILDALAVNSALTGKIAILLTADHGGGTPSNAHLDAIQVTNYTIPFFLSAPGVPAGSDLHALLENRTDPGTARPTYTEPAQPIRNGDVANLAAALLALPAVPGSLMKAELKKPLRIVRQENTITVNWPVYLTGYTLEFTDDLAGSWQTVDAGAITEASGQRSHTSSYPPPERRFFRLRAPAFALAPVPPPVTRKPHGPKRQSFPLRSSPHRKPHGL